MNASMKLGEAMYKAGQAEAGAAGAAGGESASADASKKDDGTIDADFEEVKK